MSILSFSVVYEEEQEVTPKVIQFLSALGVILLGDFAWFSLSKSLYRGSYNDEHVKLQYAVIAWVLLAFGISMLSLRASSRDAAVWGALIGLVAYGVFNGTEATIRREWRRPLMILLDILWGISICTAASITSRQVGSVANN